MFTRMSYLAISALAVVFVFPWNTSVAVPSRPLYEPPDDIRVVNYRFTARVKSNGGVTPFKPGAIIDGAFTYYLDAVPRYVARPRQALDSKRNALSFQIGGLQFSGAGNTLVTVSDYKEAEHFGIVSPDLNLPDGWVMDHTSGSQSYGILFQNAPSKGVIIPAGIPERLSLPSFVNTRELRLDFFHGVRFPGGQINERATVHAIVESLEVVHDTRRR